jgi:hypothetical protein
MALWSRLILPFEFQKEAAKSQRAHQQNNKQIRRVGSRVENRRRREFVYVQRDKEKAEDKGRSNLHAEGELRYAERKGVKFRSAAVMLYETVC